QEVEDSEIQGQGKDDNDITLAKFLQDKNASTQQENTDSDEGIRISIPLTTRKAKTYKSKQVETPKSSNTEKKTGKKKRKAKKESLWRKIVKEETSGHCQ
ncbi:hypothetical protein A2U01_0063777, partial [Trifolium medium]|nr:hypothetical protein [Trifolium medium]